MKAVPPEQSYLFEPLVRHRAQMPIWKRKQTESGIYNMDFLYPKAAENRYRIGFNRVVNVVTNTFIKYAEANYSTWQKQWRGDGHSEDLAGLTTFINSVQEEIFGDVQAHRTQFLLKRASEIDAFNVEQWGKFSGALLGAETSAAVLLPAEPWLAEVFDAWVLRNEGLWKNVTRSFIHNATQIVSSGVEQGLLWTNTRDKLFKQKGISRNRANLIARDQSGKLYSSLSERRSADAGLNLYEWLTANDERVRGRKGGKYPKANPSHAIMHRKVVRWEEADQISDDKGKTWRKKRGKEEPLQAGWAIQCRCTNKPVFAELIKAADEKIGESPYLKFF